MLFKFQKREHTVKIKAKEGIVNMAKEVYERVNPFSVEPNLDDLFEQLVTQAGEALGLLPELEQKPQLQTQVQPKVQKDDTVGIEELLR